MKVSSLKIKVTALVVVTTFLVMTTAVLLISRLEKDNSIAEMKHHSATLGESIQGAVTRAIKISFESRSNLQKLVKEIAEIDGVEEVEIFDRNRTIIAHNEPSRIGDTFSIHLPVIQEVIETGKTKDLLKSGTLIRIIPVYITEGENRVIDAIVELVFQGKILDSPTLINVITRTTHRFVEKGLTDTLRGKLYLQSLIEDLGQLRGVDHIEVFDSNFTIVAHSSPEEVGGSSAEDGPLITRIFSSGKIIEKEDIEGQTYERYMPIKIGTDSDAPVIAVAEVSFSTKEVITSIRNFERKVLVLALGISVLLAFLLTILLRQTITKRILTLKQMAKNLSSGKLEYRVNIESPDEIGDLGLSLNLMAEKLLEARTAIETQLEVRKEIDHLKDNFLAMVSHELRTPLTGVIGLSDAMINGFTGKLTQQQKDTVLKIRERGEHLNNLINNILDIESIRGGGVKMEIKKASLTSTVRQALSLIEPHALKKGVHVTNGFDLDIKPFMMDSVKVQSIISNIIGNAIKFTPSGGSIELSASLVGDEGKQIYVEFLISDTGIGIPEGERNSVFKEFHQVHETSKSDNEGVGLGLPLSRSFAMAHGGWLNLKDREGWSTTFSFGLPVKFKDFSNSLYIWKSRFHLQPMVKGIIEMLKEENSSDPGFEVSWPEAGEMEEIEADREYLRSILINIFQNSMRYRNKGSSIKIEVSSSNQILLITVENEGPHLPPEELGEIFNRDNKNMPDKHTQQSFVTLRTTNEILMSHGGTLKIENIIKTHEGIEQTGVRFTIQIPHQTSTTNTKGNPDHGKKENISC